MPIRSVGNYLQRWGFTPQKPLKRAYEQNPKAVKKRLDEKYQEIAKRPKEKKPKFSGEKKPKYAIPLNMVVIIPREARRRRYV